MNVAPSIAFGTLAGFAVGLVAAAINSPAPAELAVQEITTAVVCVSEDSPGPCYWDAKAFGNGEGTSFVRNADGSITYLPEQSA
jgi:hypothetical protein